MPLFNKTFTSGKMNKDMDERIVPNGEYRDAINIEVQSSDDSDTGSAQTLLGNTLISNNLVPAGSTCVGSIAHGKDDKIYYLVAGPEPGESDLEVEGAWKDYIIEYDIKTEIFKYVFVDIYKTNFEVESSVTSTAIDVSNDIQLLTNTALNPFTHIRSDMTVHGYNPSNYLSPTFESNLTSLIYHDTGTTGTIRLYSTSIDFTTTTITAGTWLHFSSKRILNFNKNRYITGINIVDGMLFWTDNNSEPKKINIERCIAGTGGVVGLPTGGSGIFTGDNADWHTRLCVTPDKNYPLTVKRASWDEINQVGLPHIVKEENVTVIRKAPLSAPMLRMSPHEDDRFDPITGAIADTFFSITHNTITRYKWTTRCLRCSW